MLWAAETLARGDLRSVRELLQTTREFAPQLFGRGARGARRSLDTLTETLKEQLESLEASEAGELSLSAHSSAPPAPLSIPFWWALASAIAMVVGAIGPWIKAPPGISISGIDGSNDGWLVIVVAVFAALFAYPATRYRSRGVHGLTLLTGAAGVAITAHDRHNIHNRLGGGAVGRLAHVGWGLNLALLASLSLIAAALVLLAVTSTATPVEEAPVPADVDESAEPEAPVPEAAEPGVPEPEAAEPEVPESEAHEPGVPELPAPPAPEGWPSEIEGRLETLERLKARGLVTEDEYAQKRAAILADL